MKTESDRSTFLIIVFLLCRMFELREYYDELKDASFKHTVDGFHGIKVPCGTTPCVFEMVAYQYISNEEGQEDDKSIQFSPVPRSHTPDQGIELDTFK